MKNKSKSQAFQDDIDELIQWLKSHDGKMPRSAIWRGNKQLTTDEISEEERREVNLYKRWIALEISKVLRKYEGKLLSEVPEEYREQIALIRKHKALPDRDSKEQDIEEELVEWLKDHNGKMPKFSFYQEGRKLESFELTSKQKEEKNLYSRWMKSNLRKVFIDSMEQDIEEVPEQYRENIRILRSYHVRHNVLGTSYKELIKWLKTHNGKMPRNLLQKKYLTEEERYETNLYNRIIRLEEIKILKKYEGYPIEEVPEQYRGKIAEIRKYKRKTTFEKVVDWLEEHQGMFPRKIITRNGKRVREEKFTEDEKEEIFLSKMWNRCTEKKIFYQYVDMPIEKVPETYRRKINRLREICTEQNKKKTTYEKLIDWLEEHDAQMPRAYIHKGKRKLKNHELTEEERHEVNLYFYWLRSEERRVLDEYVGKPIEEVPEEYREKITVLRGYGLTGKLLRKRKTGQEIGMATFDADVVSCDVAEKVLDELQEKSKDEMQASIDYLE